MTYEVLYGVLTPCGVPFIFLGALLWGLCGRKSGALAFRDEYAANLREMGETDRARRIEVETSIIRRRVPIYSGSLIIIGIGMLVAGVILPS